MTCGMLPVFKPAGPTSAGVVRTVRDLTGQRGIGHGGTLDPGAEGVLVLAFGRATRLLSYLPDVKVYLAEALLGRSTDSLDIHGRVLAEKQVPPLTREEIAAQLARFLGVNLQTPPMISARRHQGRRLYRLARQGQTVFRPAQPVSIGHIRLLEFAPPRVRFEVSCSRGMYVRSLVAELGESLACGACLAHLRRSFCSGFAESACTTLEELGREASQGRWRSRLVPPEEALAHLPAVRVAAAGLADIRHGRPLAAPAEILTLGQRTFRLVAADGRLHAVARLEQNLLRMEKVLSADGEA